MRWRASRRVTMWGEKAVLAGVSEDIADTRASRKINHPQATIASLFVVLPMFTFGRFIAQSTERLVTIRDGFEKPHRKGAKEETRGPQRLSMVMCPTLFFAALGAPERMGAVRRVWPDWTLR